jgi:hypothetical protein
MKSIRQLYLPYCVWALDKKRFALLNRDYRLLGATRGDWMTEVEWIKYLEQGSAKYKGLTLTALGKLTLKPPRRAYKNLDHYEGWLYDDGCIPTASAAHWKVYSDRLAKLAKFGERR